MTKRQLNIRIEDDIHTKAKVTAILKGITLNEYIEESIKTALDKDKNLTQKMKKLGQEQK